VRLLPSQFFAGVTIGTIESVLFMNYYWGPGYFPKDSRIESLIVITLVMIIGSIVGCLEVMFFVLFILWWDQVRKK
jgi:hypothetical protein